jgi:hypothetical protein
LSGEELAQASPQRRLDLDEQPQREHASAGGPAGFVSVLRLVEPINEVAGAWRCSAKFYLISQQDAKVLVHCQVLLSTWCGASE